MNTYKQLPYEDMLLECRDCHKPFDYPATEQDYFAKHSLAPPKRCRICREKKNQDRGSLAGTSDYQTKGTNVFRAPVYQARNQPTAAFSPMATDLIKQPAPASDPALSMPSNRLISQIKAENAKLREDVQNLITEVQNLKRILTQVKAV